MQLSKCKDVSLSKIDELLGVLYWSADYFLGYCYLIGRCASDYEQKCK